MNKALSIRGHRKRNHPDVHRHHVLHYTLQWPKSQRVRNTKRQINGMWYIANKNCQLSRLCMCGSARPVFALEHDLVAQYCANCPTKPDDAVDIVSRRCKCMRTQPRYAMADDARPLYCAACKPEGASRIHAKHKRTSGIPLPTKTEIRQPTPTADIIKLDHTIADPEMITTLDSIDPDMNYVEFL
jgi:hypothetical protein